MQTCISIVFKAYDSFQNKAVEPSLLTFFIDGILKKPVYKPDGYFVFTDLPEGPAEFQIYSPIYVSQCINVNIPTAGQEYIVRHLVMNPSASYPFISAATILSGTFCRGGAPCANIGFYIIRRDKTEIFKISQQKTETGSRTLKLFVSASTSLVTLPVTCLIDDKSPKNREFCTVVTHAEDDSFTLEDGLRFSHSRATGLLKSFYFTTSGDGSFFAAISGTGSGKIPVELHIVKDNVAFAVRSFELLSQKENRAGTINI